MNSSYQRGGSSGEGHFQDLWCKVLIIQSSARLLKQVAWYFNFSFAKEDWHDACTVLWNWRTTVQKILKAIISCFGFDFVPYLNSVLIGSIPFFYQKNKNFLLSWKGNKYYKVHWKSSFSSVLLCSTCWNWKCRH